MIVVTGLGAVTALGGSMRETWEGLLRGERPFSEISLFPADAFRVSLVAEARGIAREGQADFSRTSELALRAAREALHDAELSTSSARSPRVGLVVGGSTAGMLETESTLAVILSAEGAIDPRAREQALGCMRAHPLSAPADCLARELGPFVRVRSLSSACSSGANALLVGATWLELGLVDAVVCGAADALCRVTLSGFNALGALDPTGAKPFDRRRRGLTLGEGAGFVVLERAEAARARGKEAICSLLGWASCAEAHHITNPEPAGAAPSRAMFAALARAGLGPADIDYVNAHGTGTPLNDAMESRALARVFGEELRRVRVSSNKGQIGHTLAAAGAIEATISAMALAKGVVPPTGGLEEIDPECAFTPARAAEPRAIRAALSSSFGFGGMDTVLVLGQPNARPPDPRAARNVVITGVAAITPATLLEGEAVRHAPTRTSADDAITFDFQAHLDPERARRLDRVSRLAALACERALGGGGTPRLPDDARDSGVVLGNAFGGVEATASYMRRLRDKGPRLASPADFPSLVPSSPAGHVSIYLGLTGPALVVADLAATGECAITQGYELVASGEIDRVAIVAVEEKSAIVDAVFRCIFGPDGGEGKWGGPQRREGGGALALAAEEVASARGLPVLARVQQVLASEDEEALLADLAAPAARARAVVVCGAAGATSGAMLERSPWASVRRISCAEHVGSHEAAGGIAVAVAAAMLAAESLDVALCIGASQQRRYAIVLSRAQRPT